MFDIIWISFTNIVLSPVHNFENFLKNSRWDIISLYVVKAAFVHFGLIVVVRVLLLFQSQLFEGKQPFEGMDPIKAAAAAASNGLRPQFKNPRVIPKIKELIEELWDPIAQRRPNFMEVLVRLDALDRTLKLPTASGRQKAAIGRNEANSQHVNRKLPKTQSSCACVVA